METFKLSINSITITYLSKVTFASLNGADKEVDNINPIKKITMSDGGELPYISSQAIRRALRDKLKEFNYEMSPIDVASAAKGAPKTATDSYKYVDDDLFGYMDAAKGSDGEKGKSKIRTSPIRVESLVALNGYKGDLDFATNYMGKEKGIDPNIFETEIHSGIYRGTILIELDRIGCGQGFEEKELEKDKRLERVLAFINSFQNLWSSGRQSRFLADLSPKFIAAALMKTKNPIFLESVNLDEASKINVDTLKTVINDYSEYIEKHVLAVQEGVFEKVDDTVGLKDGFKEIKDWVKQYYMDDKNV